MKLNFNKLRRGRASTDKQERKPGRFRKLAASAAAAAMLCFSPLADRTARAEEARETEPTGEPTRRTITLPETVVETGERERPASGPSEDASPEAPAPESAPSPPPEEAPAQPERPAAPEEERQPEEGQGIFSHNLSLEPMRCTSEEVGDPALSASPNLVDIRGRCREISLDNDWDMGGNIYGNEAGNAVFGSVRFRDLARFDGGNVWFGELAVPFARLYIRPEINLWRFRLAYYGSLAFAGNLPSYLYTSHSAGLGFSYPISVDSSDSSRRLWIRTGIVGGGALSYPAFDDMYYNLVTGLSIQLTGYPDSRFDYTVYGMGTFFAAADNPIKTAYIGYYEPQFQSAEVGAQARIFDDFTLRFFTELGMLNRRYAMRGTWTVEFSDAVSADFWAAGGATHWHHGFFNNRVDPLVMLGATIVVGGEHMNSTNTSRYEHLQNGGVSYAETDFPDEQNYGPYGYGIAGEPVWDSSISEAKRRILEHGGFEDFVHSYRNDSEEEVIRSGRFLLAFIQQVAYAHDAVDSLYNADLFSSEVVRVASANNQTIYNFLRGTIDHYEANGLGAPLPEHLRNGIAVCAGAHWLVGNLFQQNGIDTLVLGGISTPRGMHVIAASRFEDRTTLFDWGNTYTGGADRLDELIRFYGREHGSPTWQIQVFDPSRGRLVGTMVLSEGRLWHQVTGIDNGDILRREFLNIR
ncbi:hypothetical protein GF318_05290 [Candidatus Micrarchaeota archaeon]|nr:hypothetical protein [Candidatus Micrarchaeota archaeon]